MTVIQTINPALFEVETLAEKLAGENASWDRCEQMIWMAAERLGIDCEKIETTRSTDWDDDGVEFEIINVDLL